jgi:formate-dependent nitrite reductase cytochrome c552 subunit
VVTAGLTYYFTPKYTRVGYQPTQPVPFSHSIHVQQLGLDCRYCHDGVEKSWYSNVPAADTCMNCHSAIRADDPKLEPVRASYKDANKPVEWVQIHKLPDYVYFNHSVHVNRGVSCVECHGRIDQMDEVRHEKQFSMTFCLDCHRNPEPRLRPLDKITDLAYDRSSDAANKDREFVKEWHIKTSENCSACHR